MGKFRIPHRRVNQITDEYGTEALQWIPWKDENKRIRDIGKPNENLEPLLTKAVTRTSYCHISEGVLLVFSIPNVYLLSQNLSLGFPYSL